MKADEPRQNRIPFMMSDTELAAVDEWRFANKIATRAEAIRRLCQIGLRFDEAADDLHKDVNAIMERLVEAASEVNAGLSAEPRRYDYAAVHGAAFIGEMLDEQAKITEKIIALIYQARSLKVPGELPSAIGTADEIKENLANYLKELESNREVWERPEE